MSQQTEKVSYNVSQVPPASPISSAAFAPAAIAVSEVTSPIYLHHISVARLGFTSKGHAFPSSLVIRKYIEKMLARDVPRLDNECDQIECSRVENDVDSTEF